MAGGALLGATWLLLVSGAATAVGAATGLDPVGAALVAGARRCWLVLASGCSLLSVAQPLGGRRLGARSRRA